MTSICPGTLEAAFVRSPHAHALIRSIDKAAALAVPGVHAVLTLADLKPHLTTERLAVALPTPAFRQVVDRPILADGEVVHVGEPIAIVIADNRYIAEDAAVLVDIDYEPLPAAVDCRAALEADAPRAHRGAPHNLVAEFNMEFGDVDAAFSGAAHVFRESLWQHRGGSHSIEGRGVLAAYDPVEDRLTVVEFDADPACLHAHAVRSARAGTRTRCACWRRMSAAASARNWCSIRKTCRSRLRRSSSAGR